MTIKSWNNQMNPEAALDLPQGTLVANFGGLRVEQSINPKWVVEAAKTFVDIFKSTKEDYTFYSQSGLIATCQEQGLAFQDWVSSLEDF